MNAKPCTPANWWKVYNPDVKTLAVLVRGKTIAEWPENYDAEDLADAYVIAAAPALLDAARELVETIHATDHKCGFGVPLTPKNNPCNCSQHAGYYNALAAIARAEQRHE